MRKLFAFVFPGQGSQHIGMLTDLATHFPLIIDTFNRASDVLGYDLWLVCQEGPEEKLNQTQITQPALLAAGMAIWRVWQKQGGPKAHMLAGHSLGEYTALACANAISYEVAIKLVETRGKCMQNAVPAEVGSMAAIIGLKDEQVEELCHLAGVKGIVSPANYNCPGQVVVAGNTDAVDELINLAKQKGAKLAKKLAVSVPSHCELMKPAALEFEDELRRLPFKVPDIPVIHNADVCYYNNIKDIQNALTRQLYSPVRWVETVQRLVNEEIYHLIETGPGKVLTGLNKRINENITASTITTSDSIKDRLDQIGDL